MTRPADVPGDDGRRSQSAFVRGFIDDVVKAAVESRHDLSQSAFVRGFIDDDDLWVFEGLNVPVSIRVRARLHR